MKTLFKSAVFSTVMLALCCQATVQAQSVAPKAVEQVDIQRYAGKWYEIAHLPIYFQRKCVSNVTAEYTINPDQSIRVENTCKTDSGKTLRSEALAHAKNAGNSQLKVSFLPKGLRWLPFTKGDYWILRLDPEYKVVLVGGPSDKYLWILSREPQIDEATYQSYLETAKHYGYDVSRLIQLPH